MGVVKVCFDPSRFPSPTDGYVKGTFHEECSLKRKGMGVIDTGRCLLPIKWRSVYRFVDLQQLYRPLISLTTMRKRRNGYVVFFSGLSRRT